MSDSKFEITGTDAGRADDPADQSSLSPTPQPTGAKVIDLADAFGGGGDTPPPVSMERLRTPHGDPVLAIGFTTVAASAHDHWVDDWGYSLCPRHHSDGRCPLCDLGKDPEEIIVIPVYEPDRMAVSVLRVPVRRKPGSLWTEMKKNFFDPFQVDEAPRVLTITHKGQGQYTVESNPVPEGVDNGVDVIASWYEAFEAGEIDLTAPWSKPTDAELRAMPAIEQKLKLRGLA